MSAPPAADAGLYLHIPFCSAICPYCDFAVRADDAALRARFVTALEREMARHAGTSMVFDTIYLGGGTPSLLAPTQLATLLATARASLPIRPDARIFLEANPEDVDEASLAAWRQLGVATLSLGVQSLDPDELRFLGRHHSPEVARRSVRLAREAGFSTVSFDLIYGLPEQPLAAWQRNLEAAVALEPDHLSCYQLTLEPRTPFGNRHARGTLKALPEDQQGACFELAHTFLAAAGLPGYEVSNFTRSPAHRSQHNRKYWHHTPYLGLGPAAHSFDGRDRFWNERLLPRWQARLEAGQSPEAGRETLTPAQRALEALMLGLRTYDGIDLAAFQAHYAVDLEAQNRERLARLIGAGHLQRDGDHLRPTLSGLAIAEGMAAGLVLETTS